MSERITDSSGLIIDMTEIEEVKPGDAIAEAWRPWLVVEEVVSVGEQLKMKFVGGHEGGLIDAGELVPVLVFDPKVDETGL